ncbi:MAG TPA: hypothetical protein GXX46_04645, partial [Peptococcaceae bacterium]|nr:hypothetical protein [Peptococcaceae bacterium]
MKKIISLVLCFFMVFALCPSVFAANTMALTGDGSSDESPTVWEVANATELENALNGFQSGDTIRLTADFTYYKGIVIDGKTVTFDTNSFILTVYNVTDYSPGVGLEVINGGNVYLTGSGQLYIRKIGGNGSYGVKVTNGSTAMVTNVQATVFANDAVAGVYADGTGSSIHVLGKVHVAGSAGYGAKTRGGGRITIDGTITAMNYIDIDSITMDEASGVDDFDNPGYLKYSLASETGIVWVKAIPVTESSAPQDFTATPGDTEVTLSWAAPVSDGGAAIFRYEVSCDNGSTWVTASTGSSHTFTGLTNGTEYTFKVRALNLVGTGEEASVTATPGAVPVSTHTVNFFSDGSLYASKTVTGGSALGDNWPVNPTKSGYSFGGWFTGENGAGTQYTNDTIIIADVDLYAKWTYIGGGGGGSTPPATVYKAVVKAGSGTEKELLITVDNNTGIASIEED